MVMLHTGCMEFLVKSVIMLTVLYILGTHQVRADDIPQSFGTPLMFNVPVPSAPDQAVDGYTLKETYDFWCLCRYVTTPVVSSIRNTLVYNSQNAIWMSDKIIAIPVKLFDIRDRSNVWVDSVEEWMDITNDGTMLVFGLNEFDPAYGSYASYDSTWVGEPSDGGYLLAENFEGGNPVHTLHTLNIITGEYRDLGITGIYPAWYSSRVFFSYSYCGNKEDNDPEYTENMLCLALYNTITGMSTFLTDESEGKVYQKTFTSDDSSIIYLTVHETERKIMKVNINSGEKDELMQIIFDCSGFSLSSDNRWLLTSDGTQIVLIDLEKQRVIDLFDCALYDGECDTGFPAACPYWLPDESGFVYTLHDASSGNKLLMEKSVDMKDYEEDVLAVAEDEPPQPFPALTAFPNPFNPSTTLQFNLPDAGHVELTVYTVSGQHVRTLISGELGAGIHMMQWDGRDDRGNQMSSGVYFSRLVTNAGVMTGSMTLVK